MITQHKSRTFGDIDANGPDTWEWGGADDSTIPESDVHILLLLFAKDEVALASLQDEQITKAENSGLKHLKTLATEPEMLMSNKEHFGFTDGIGQPYVEGFTKYNFPDNTIKLGEFVLGYDNEYNKLPDAPYIKDDEYDGAAQYLEPKDDKEGYLDLGKNGSFLVFRQLDQHVINFWKYVKAAAENQTHNGETDTPIRVASKMVGRWPNGNPLAVFPNSPEGTMKDQNHFNYHHKDLKGFGCPIGSHLRRSNPRDAFEDDPEKAIKFVKKNRILRRGRGYGKPIEGALDNDVEKVLSSTQEDKDRGLQFLCFNSHLSRQFELVQAQWLCNPKFLGAYDEVDPIAGHHPMFKDANDPENDGQKFNTFNEPARQVRKKYYNVPRFISVKGGAYFFTPGINAVRFLANFKPKA